MTYAKTSPPALLRVFGRTRLYDWLDQHRERRAIWIQGQAGAGKTTLVTSYLEQRDLTPVWYRVDAGDDHPATFFHYFNRAVEGLLPAQFRQLPKPTPESLSNLTMFARFYFRELFDKLPQPLLLVFDNLQEIDPDASLHTIIAVALDELPRDMRAILISRNPPQSAFSRMRLNRGLALLGQEALRLTDEESLGLARLWSRDRTQAESIRYVNKLVDGWVAGFVLMLEHGGREASATEVGRQYFFNYFASEVFDKLDAERRSFLLHTACPTDLTVTIAQELTGMAEAETILEDLCARHYFTSRSDKEIPIYQYHPLFREFLLSRGLKDLGAEQSRRITVESARILARDGQIEDAARLAQAAADWSLLGELVCQQAPILLAQQRFEQLEQWLKQLPQHELDASPWLSYWLGCCRLPFDQQESGRHFESAYADFEAEEESAGMLLAASGAVLAVLTEWDDFRPLDPWIEALDAMAPESGAYPNGTAEGMVVLAMLGALLFRMPGHQDMERWEAHAERLIHGSDIDLSLRIDIGNALVHWKYWKGNLAGATRITDLLTQLIELGGSAILPRLQSAMNAAIHSWHMAEFDACLDTVTDGLALAEETGIHIMDDRLLSQGVYASLSRDDLPTARRLLDRMKTVLQEGRRLSVSHYYLLSSNYHLIAGDLETARQHSEIALQINREVGAPFPEGLAGITMAQIQFELGALKQATTLVAAAGDIARAVGSKTLELLHALTCAWFESRLGYNDSAVTFLRNGLALQRETGFLNLPGWRNSMMKPLLLMALENDIETTFVQRLIRLRGLHTETPPQASENWPWPVRVHTLGRFLLVIDDELLCSNGKTQQKPLELLKTLIALGSWNVGRDQLIDALWPDAEGDRAQRALDTTLHRLRKMVGYEQAIQLQDRKLSLNSRLCWVDVWAVERLVDQIEIPPVRSTASGEQLMQLQQQLVSLHQDRFLSGDSEPVCINSYRDRLHNRLLNRLTGLGHYWEEQHDWHRASNLYHQMLEMDDRQETPYQRLMICYRNLGQIAEAMSVYERCRTTLSAHYGISPAALTEAIYQSLI